jgi:glycosyltransferase involved in cell wall biosynthesis
MEPRFSVLVPVYEQWDLVPKLLACLAAQTLPQDQFEVILADNGSTEFAPPAKLPPNVRVITCPEPGSYATRNAAAAQARGQWFAFTDADCLPDPGWLAGVETAARASDGRTLLVGAVELRARTDKPNAYEMYDMIAGIPQQRYASRGWGATANLTVPAALFHEAGGFDGTRLSGGDAEFCRRATERTGARVEFVATARVGHPARDSWAALATKSRRILGGQITMGPFRRRMAFMIRALAPPVIAWSRFARSDKPMGHKVTAILVQTRLWGSEVVETARLLLGQRPERR